MEICEKFVKRIKELPDEELDDLYDTMCSNRNCQRWQFNAVRKEVYKRAEEDAAEEAFGRFEWDYNPYNGFESVD